MSNGIIPHTAEQKARLITASALVHDNPNNAEAIAANYGTDPESILELLATREGMSAALIRAEELRQDGELLKRKTIPLLERLTDQIGDMIDAGQISATAAPKVAETLFKLSGLAEERAARLRAQTEDDTPKAAIHILYGDEPEPSDPKGNKYRIVIRLPNAQREAGDIIDVTPTEGEGGGDGA